MNDPWWAVPTATLAGVMITVAATATLEHFRGLREREARLSDTRRQAYTEIASLVRRQMALLKEGYENFQARRPHSTPEEARETHRQAAVLASLIGSPELVDTVDLQYQTSLEAWLEMRRATVEMAQDLAPDIKRVADRVAMAEEEALRAINILRRDTGIPGEVWHQWF